MNPLKQKWARAMAQLVFVMGIFSFLSEGAVSQSSDLTRFERAKTEFSRGIAHFNSMQYLAAVEYFRKAMIEYPDYHTAREYLARALRLSGFTDEAIREWENLADASVNKPAIQNKIDLLRARTVNLATEVNPMDLVLSQEFQSSAQRRHRYPKPIDLAVDSEKNIYITSFTSGRIVKLDLNGNALDTYSAGIDGKFYGIDIHKDLVAASEFKGDKIYLLKTNLDLVASFGGPGNGDGRFHGPEGLCFDAKGYLYVVDSGNHRVQKFDRSGNFILSFGEFGDYKGQLNNPTDITASNDRVYVTDLNNKRIACFDDSGNFLFNRSIEGCERPRGITVYQDFLVIADEHKGLLFYHLKNRLPLWPQPLKETKKNFSRLFSAALDRDGALYCLDYEQESVFVFSSLMQRYTNLDVEITSIDTKKYPVVAVYLNVRNRGGSPVYGLKKENFSLTEDSARIGQIYIDYLKDKTPAASIVLCVDRSSENQSYHQEMPWVADFILKKMKKNDQIKLLNFNSDFWIGNNFDWSRLRTLKALKKRDYASGKNFGRALYDSVASLASKITRRSIVVITDGALGDDSFQAYTADNIIQYANSHYVPITFVTFKEKNPVLQRIASATGGMCIKASELDSLRKIYERVKGGEEYRYVAVYYSFKMTDFKGWWSDLKVEVNDKGQRGVEWGGYFVP